MVSAYVESLKLRVGTFIGLAAVLGYLATLPTAPRAEGPALPALTLLFVATVIAAGGAGALNHVLDRDLDLHPGAGGEVRLFEVRQRQGLLEERRPAAGGRVADLRSLAVDRDARPPGDVADLRRQVVGGEEPLEGGPLDLEPHESPQSTPLALRDEPLPKWLSAFVVKEITSEHEGDGTA